VSYRAGHQVLVVEADERGQIHGRDVLVAGDLLGGMSAARAVESGRRVALELAKGLQPELPEAGELLSRARRAPTGGWLVRLTGAPLDVRSRDPELVRIWLWNRHE
jgi:hypothetical protein